MADYLVYRCSRDDQRADNTARVPVGVVSSAQRYLARIKATTYHAVRDGEWLDLVPCDELSGEQQRDLLHVLEQEAMDRIEAEQRKGGG